MMAPAQYLIRILTRPGVLLMRAPSAFRSSLIALLTLIGVTFDSAAYADSGRISFRIIKAGFVIGGSAGSGTLFFHGRQYALGIGGLSYGFTFGASETRFHGVVSNIRAPSDVAGVYAAGNVGAAVGPGAQAIVLANPKGAVLNLTGNSVGAIVSADLNGLAITVR
jgi:lipid-binding SYLF domain-containing protein